ncbi:MAG: vanadium-dependent haloperoxidase [Gemmatimonadaceae bacterium]|nr:vanadium-dependent haloperoxidase [Gemmatimonadaceae bacterium]
MPARRGATVRSCIEAVSICLALVSVGCTRAPAPADPQLVSQWMRTSLAFVRTERLGPPVAARISAYSAIALYEGYASDSRSPLRSLSGQLNGLAPLAAVPAGVSLDGAVVAAEAERVVMDSLFRDGMIGTRRTIDSLAAAQIASRVRAGVTAADSARSVDQGRLLGHAILAWAATDSFFATRGRAWAPSGRRSEWTNTATVAQFVPQTMSGQSDLVLLGNPNVREDVENATAKGTFTNRPKADGPTTLPAFNPVKPTEPYWGQLRPFVLGSADDCAPPKPPVYAEDPGSPFYAMGKQFHDSIRALTPAQKQIALFWADNPVATGTPGFHWISVVNQMVSRRALSADAAAEVYALTSVAIADAFISCWREKYRSNVVRPETWVRRVLDPAFQTVIPTPPFPEYPSGHSVQSGAAVDVLIATLGDTIPFIDSTQVDIGQAPRPFASFSAAADEVAISRVYAGVHYYPAVIDGMAQGRCIGRKVSALRTRRGA